MSNTPHNPEEEEQKEEDPFDTLEACFNQLISLFGEGTQMDQDKKGRDAGYTLREPVINSDPIKFLVSFLISFPDYYAKASYLYFDTIISEDRYNVNVTRHFAYIQAIVASVASVVTENDWNLGDLGEHVLLRASAHAVFIDEEEANFLTGKTSPDDQEESST